MIRLLFSQCWDLQKDIKNGGRASRFHSFGRERRMREESGKPRRCKLSMRVLLRKLLRKGTPDGGPRKLKEQGGKSLWPERAFI